MAEPARRVSALEIAAALGMPPPTPQQQAVIESSAVEPALVVAGAGSGKTETMASRVLWLVANGHARPSQILGLTFTRKAAGELAERMQRRIAQLRAAGLVPELVEADGQADHGEALLDVPAVSTYNAFAGSIFRDHASLIGYDADAVVLGEAGAFLLARSIATAAADPRLVDLDRSVDAIAGAVLELSGKLADNLADGEAVSAMAAEFARLRELESPDRFPRESVVDAAAKVGALPVLVELAERFRAAKAERGFIEFSDQVALALRIVERHPRVGEELRERVRIVILDEYQDTSVVQSRLLATLFRGHPVMAVGDPNQAIYGWRGASASNLGQFGRWFPGTTEFALSTSWRNGTEILRAANALIEPLAGGSGVRVEPLGPRPGADAEPVELRYPATIREEAAQVAAWFREHLADRRRWSAPAEGAPPEPPSAALIMRSRSTLRVFAEALDAAGVPVHVLGVDQLLAEPVIADLVAALAVVDDPSAGSELVRLLVGARFRIGTADLVELRELGRWLDERDLAQQRLDDEVRRSLRRSVDEEDGASLVDALDFLSSAREGHSRLERFSEEGLARLREAGRLFAELRTRGRLDLLDLVTVVMEALHLDLELAANDARPGAWRAIEAFRDALSGFLQLGELGAGRPSLGAFLRWLRAAQEKERLAPRSEPAEPGCVQIITIHGAKGLEWDLVAVPRLVKDELPGRSRETSGWLSFGELPFEFRGDADALPVLPWREVADRKEFDDAKKAFAEAMRARQLGEDRRLAYVAVTRARHRLLLTGSFWSHQASAREPSAFLRELEAAGVVAELPTEAGERPEDLDPDPTPWPRDPLGARRERVLAAAAAVTAADAARAAEGPWARDLELLLRERDERLRAVEAELPSRIPASRFKDFVRDRRAVVAELRRPMPERPYRATRLGTLFHAWVEQRGLQAAPADELDLLASELDLGADDLLGADGLGADGFGADGLGAGEEAEAFARLRATFEASPWGRLKPVEVEREIHLPFDGRIVVCKIDAVYELDGGRVEIVDWKTGRAPSSPEDLDEKQLQLALYRLAYARWSGLELERIDAAFYFVAEDRVIRPARLDDEAALLARWRGGSSPSAGRPTS
ncbi:ATP-dependent helicase [Homoserinibacter sp. YIM 151385]|uniref:ATP-dependent helicase n=1 Tax=Homoserinibacter sp. YIM 151385 TaxID=2985506 RepID=UPI0022F00D53|nr:ATP-dependent DNA helicase [Homoserinibacter sp. YIM 151385]WBU38152.1 ATP-dependent DNA helicase [Homoserinibacter sp. YIM 151385]